MTDAPPVREITLGDLGGLSLRGNVAMAARCARRLRPCLERLPATYPNRDETLKIVDQGIALAENYALARDQDEVRAAAISFDVFQVAETVEKVGQYAAYGVSHAARAAAEALRVGPRANDQDVMEIVACTYGTIRVTLNGGTGGRLQESIANVVRGAMRADYDALCGLGLGPLHEPGRAVDATESGPLGPLWPQGAPPGY